MSLSFIGLLLLTVVLVLVVFLVVRAVREKKKSTHALVAYTREVGEQHRLQLTHQQLFDLQLLALDEPQKKLLVITQSGAACRYTLADLRDVKSCKLVKSQQTVPLDKEGKRKDTFLDAITLVLEPARNQQEPFSIGFYSHSQHSVYLIAEREQLAKQWQERISLLLKA